MHPNSYVYASNAVHVIIYARAYEPLTVTVVASVLIFQLQLEYLTSM